MKTKEGKKVQIDKKVVDPRADPIPKPPQYPCARPPRGYVPPRVAPNASPGMIFCRFKSSRFKRFKIEPVFHLVPDI